MQTMTRIDGPTRTALQSIHDLQFGYRKSALHANAPYDRFKGGAPYPAIIGDVFQRLGASNLDGILNKIVTMGWATRNRINLQPFHRFRRSDGKLVTIGHQASDTPIGTVEPCWSVKVDDQLIRTFHEEISDAPSICGVLCDVYSMTASGLTIIQDEPADNGPMEDDANTSETIEPVRFQPVSPELWRRNLEGLRDAFFSARSQHGPLRCPLFQNTTSKADAQRPPFDITVNSVSSKAVSYHYFRSYVTTGGKPIYLKNPIVDVNGTPIVDSQGRGLACAMPTGRIWSYNGTAEASVRFGELARRAGRALLGSNQSNLSWIPTDTLLAREDEDRWVWAIFDLAWQGRHPSLSAERRTWFRASSPSPRINTDAVRVPYDIHKLRALQTLLKEAPFSFPEEWTERLSGYFVSELPDLFQASADLIDFLLDRASQADAAESGCRDEEVNARNEVGPASLAPESHQTVAHAKSYSVADLREMTGLGNEALNRYAKDAKVKTPGRGQRNFRYPANDVKAILTTIIAETAERATRAKCQSALHNLREISK